MSGVKGEVKSRGLIATLCVLGVAVVGLIVGNVVVLLNSGGEQQPVDESPEEVVTYTPMDEQQQAEFNAYQSNFSDVMAEYERVKAKGISSASDISGVFLPVVERYLSENNYADAQTYISLLSEELQVNGFKREALDFLKTVDFSSAPVTSQNRYYHRIVDLANEFGDEEAIAKYQPLIDATEEEAQKANAESAEWARKKREEVMNRGEAEE